MNYITIEKGNPQRVEPVYVSPLSELKTLDENISDRFRIIIISSGVFIAQINDKSVQIIAPAVLCITEKDSIVISDNQEIKFQAFYFHPEFLNKSLNFSNVRQEGMDIERNVIDNRMILNPFVYNQEYNYCRFISPEDYVRISEMMESARYQLEEQDSGWWPCKTRSYLSEILFFVMQIFEQNDNNPDIQIKDVSSEFKPILDYVNRFYNTKITLDSLCREFGTNRTYLNKRFNKETGMSAINYLIDLRLRIALLMLTNTELPVSEIAERTGFSDSTHFERLFKKKYGKRPNEIRKSDSSDRCRN